MVLRKEDLVLGWEKSGLNGRGGERDGGRGAVTEVGQRREVGDRLTLCRNPTRPSELH